MSYVAPPTPRATVAEDLDGLRITIPARGSWGGVAFLGVWLCCWGMGELTVLRVVVFGQHPPPGKPGPPAAFLAFWLVIWTGVGLMAVLALLWKLVGREVIVVDGPGLVLIVRHQFGLFRRARWYDLDQVRNLRVAPLSAVDKRSRKIQTSNTGYPGFNSGVITFDYGAGTFRVGIDIDEAEARGLVRMLKDTFRIPDDKP